MTRNSLDYGIARLCLFISCLSLTGCIHISADSGYAGPKPLPAAIREAYAYQKFQGDYQEEILQQKSHYTLKRISFPSSHNVLPLPHFISIDYYALDGLDTAPVVMVLPILDGGKDITANFARYFARHGFATVVVHRQKEYKSPGFLEQINAVLRQMVFDHRQAIDWIETRPELDASKIAVFGISMGGIKGALLSALDERIAATVLVLVGGDIPYILTHSREKGISRERRALLAERELTVEELQQELAAKIDCDPINYAEYIDAATTLMILARLDEVVPYRKGLELKEKIGNPETITLLSGHYSAILYIFYVEYQARKFFERQLR
jgi:pimeloyl-ACP methyl ester carboxylesterase